MSFLIVALLIVPPIPLQGEWASGCMVLICWPEWNHDTRLCPKQPPFWRH